MCGIFGIVTRDDQKLGDILIDAGRRLSYRGYDSVGCATISSSGTIDLRKDVGKIDKVANDMKFSDMRGNRGIVQLRWATFGDPSPENAQPHIDSDGDLVGAHNGNVVNNVELREQFINDGFIVRSTNDGETCVHAVERYIDKGFNYIDAIRMAYQDLSGDYAFIIGSANDERLFAIKKGSGLVVGIGNDFTCISSDMPSILPKTRNVIRINDGEIIALSHDKVDIFSVSDGTQIFREIETITDSMESVQKGGYDHFMLKEIYEQPKVAQELLHILDNSSAIDPMLEILSHTRNIYFVGCGTSYHACLAGAVYFAQLAKIPVIPVLAPQFIAQYSNAVGPNDVGIFVSQSGETKDVLNAINSSKSKGMHIFGLVNVIGSTLAQDSEYHLPLACGYEISVPATKTFTNQLIAFLYLAMRMGNKNTDSLHNLPAMIEQTLHSLESQIKDILPALASWNSFYTLGYGTTYPIALEGALKIKEITYVHCEGMLSTEFKHGPLSAVKDGLPVIYIAGPEDTHLIVSGINEVTCRGGNAIAIGQENSQLLSNADQLIPLPISNQYINSILSVLPLQLLSYHLSVFKGINPDFPRNLSKTLTVD